jgi:hypothetical protein
LGEEQLGEINGIKNNSKDIKWNQFVTLLEFCGLIVETPKSVAILWLPSLESRRNSNFCPITQLKQPNLQKMH